METKKLTLEQLRTLITEALNEDSTDAGEIASDEHEAQVDSEEAEDQLSEGAQLQRWKKLAGLLKD
tara:strand:+ start:360 stop:557 length:198 start_codon:yes stop_codon:yes gene_type:complete